jgi:hypothetical protein
MTILTVLRQYFGLGAKSLLAKNDLYFRLIYSANYIFRGDIPGEKISFGSYQNLLMTSDISKSFNLHYSSDNVQSYYIYDDDSISTAKTYPSSIYVTEPPTIKF